MKDIDRFKNTLALDKNMQAETLTLDPESEAFAAYAKRNGYNVSIADVDEVLKDLLWLARVGDDIDHA